MPRLRDYERAQTVSDNDLLLIDQEGNTKNVTIETLKKTIGGEKASDITVELEE